LIGPAVAGSRKSALQACREVRFLLPVLADQRHRQRLPRRDVAAVSLIRT